MLPSLSAKASVRRSTHPLTELGAPKNVRREDGWTLKGIRQIVADMGLGLTDQQAADLDRAVREEYVTRAEHAEKVTRIEALTQQVADLTERAKQLDGDATKLEELRQRVAEYERAEAERQQAEAEREARAEFEAKLGEAVGDRKWANSMTRAAVLDRAWAHHQKNPDVGAAEVLAAVVGDEQGVWQVPQASPHRMPAGSDEKTTRADLSDFAAQLFGPRRV